MSDATIPAGTRTRLDHIDAMRPLKETAVISTHGIIFFGIGASALANANLLIFTHFSREAFLFVSACMLTYSYRDLDRVQLGHYWRRRLFSVGLPFITWTVLYFLFTSLTNTTTFPYYELSWHSIVGAAAFHKFLRYTFEGYYHLYYLIVILEFYVVFPPLLLWVRRTRRWHVPIFLGALAFQALFSIAISMRWIPGIHPGFWQTRLLFSYPLYLVGGMIVALHLNEVHDWVCAHAKAILSATVVFGLGALTVNLFSISGTMAKILRPGANPFSITVIPYNVGATLSVYLLGVWLVSPRRSTATRAITKSGSDNSYGIYLTQMIWIPILARLRDATGLHLPWLLAIALGVSLTFVLGWLFTALAARTPLARALVGRGQTDWGSLIPHRGRVTTIREADAADGPLELELE